MIKPKVYQYDFNSIELRVEHLEIRSLKIEEYIYIGFW